MSEIPNQSAPPTGTDAPPLPDGALWIDHLPDGAMILIRPLPSDDREGEEDFLRALSPQAWRYRFLCNVRVADPAPGDQLMDMEGDRRMAFVALAHEDGRLHAVGVSRYSTTDEASRCECAVTVAENWRHRGLAVLLMRRLIRMAREGGFRQMFSIDAADNRPMQELAACLGFRRSRDPNDPSRVVHVLAL